MKNKLITMKADQSEIDRWKSALAKEDKSLSEIVRAALNRFAVRVEKKDTTWTQ